jgi:hypothetical protein
MVSTMNIVGGGADLFMLIKNAIVLVECWTIIDQIGV